MTGLNRNDSVIWSSETSDKIQLGKGNFPIGFCHLFLKTKSHYQFNLVMSFLYIIFFVSLLII
jgi:hypothetical protein